MIAIRNAVGGAVAAKSALILGAMVGLGALAPVSAADLGGYRGGSLKDDAMPVLAQSAARFYVRVDGSYANYDRPALLESGQFDLINSKIDTNWSVGGGFGYYVNKNIRFDVTAEERFKSNVSGTNGDTANFGTGASRNFSLKSEVYLANLYYDFDSRGRFTPYIGAGLGVVEHHTSAGTAPNYCANQPSCLGTTDGYGTIGSGSSSSVAAALMAGVSINLTGRGLPAGSGESFAGDAARNLYVDVGYRFLYLGDVVSGQLQDTINVGNVTASDVHAHEFRVGLRYDFH